MIATARRPLLLILALSAACARPTLYYPTPISPAPAAPAAPAPAEAVDSISTPAPSASADVEYLRSRHIVMPVAGATMRSVEDSFDDPRDAGRVHRAVDIRAARGTPILAADDGQVLRLSTNKLGGITIYATDNDRRIVYYYAHLDRYHPSLSDGRQLLKGDTIGFVGTTGNAPKNVPHLHFQIMRMAVDGKYWDGEPINPFPLLTDAIRPAAARAIEP